MQEMKLPIMESEELADAIMKLLDASDICSKTCFLDIGKESYNSSIYSLLDVPHGSTLLSYESYIYGDDLPAYQLHIKACVDNPDVSKDVKYRLVTAENKTKWVKEYTISSRLNERGEVVCVTSMLRDISKDEKAIRRGDAEEKYREYIAHIGGVGSFVYNLAAKAITFSTDFYGAMTKRLHHFDGSIDTLGEIVNEHDFVALKQALADYMEKAEGVFTFNLRVKSDDNVFRWLHVLASVAQRDNQGLPSTISGALIDIDDAVVSKYDSSTFDMNELLSMPLDNEIDDTIHKIDANRMMANHLLENSPSINVIVDLEGNLIDCNSTYMRFVGATTKADAAKNFRSILDECSPVIYGSETSLHDKFVLAVENGGTTFEASAGFADGVHHFSVLFKKVPYENTHCILCYLSDTTKLINAQEKLLKHEQFLNAVNHVAEALMETFHGDVDYSIRYAMKAIGEPISAVRVSIWRNEQDSSFCASRYAGWTEDIAFEDDCYEAIFEYGKHIPEWCHDELYRSDVVQNADFMRLMNVDLENCQAVEKVLLIPLNVSGKFWGFIAFGCPNAVRLRHVERDILHSGGMLIATAIIKYETTQNLVEAKENALASIKSKNEFLSRMSHEIRTPMNAIIGMTILAKKAKTIDEVRQYLHKVEVSSNQLLNLINDILDMSKIDANKMEISETEFDLEKTIEGIISVIQVKSQEKEQFLNIDLNRVFHHNIITDELKLTQVMTNLLSNAVKFTPANGTVTLKIRERDLDNDETTLVIEVTDNGIGIDPKLQDKIFMPFEQVDGSVTRQFGGTGLGLSICKRIVDLMGGMIRVDSIAGYGSTFHVELPVKWGGLIKDEPLQQELDPNLRVLIVDDRSDVLLYFKTVVGSFGLHCDAVNNGDEAIALAEAAIRDKRPYDLILLDWYMPVKSGGETAEQLSQIVDNNAFVILISVADWIEIEAEAKKVGITRHIAKPILPSTLYTLLVGVSNHSMPTQDEISDPTSSYDWSGYNLLLVEDNEINREIITVILEDTGLSIDCAENGKQGVRMFRMAPEKYDLIFMDVQMPVLDGLSATRLIRSSDAKEAREIPIIAMTANAFKEDQEECLAAGMDDYFSKPLDVHKMLEKMDAVFAASKKRKVDLY